MTVINKIFSVDVINICICITCIFKSIFTYTKHLILKCCNKPLKIQIENN